MKHRTRLKRGIRDSTVAELLLLVVLVSAVYLYDAGFDISGLAVSDLSESAKNIGAEILATDVTAATDVHRNESMREKATPTQDIPTIRAINSKGITISARVIDTKASESAQGRRPVTLKIDDPESPIDKIEFEDANAGDYSIGIDYVPETNPDLANTVEIYAIDPTQVDFTRAVVTAVAKGTELWKCEDWNFAEQRCEGSWVKLMDIVPGQPYTFTLTPDDPGYAETGARHAWLAYYTSTNPTLPKYRTWNNTLSSEANASDIGASADAEWVVLKASTVRDEKTLATLDDLGIVNAQIWNASGQSWGNLKIIATGIGTTNDAERGLDVAHEQTSGRSLVVASNGTADPVYNIWNGTTWLFTESQLMSTDGCTGTVIWVTLKSKSGSDEILEVDQDANGDYCAQVWNGSSWINNKTLSATPTLVSTTGQFDAAYEASSGDAIVVWEDETSAGLIDYNTYSSGTWGTSATSGLDTGASENEWLELASMPGADRIMLLAIDNDNDVTTREWNGTAWQTATQIDATIETGVSTRRGDVAYIGSSGDAMMVYDDANQDVPSYFTCSGTGCAAGTWVSGGTTTTATDFCGSSASDLAWIGLVPDPFSNKIYLWGKAQTNFGKCFQEYSGTAWGTWNGNLGGGSILVDTEDVMASADRFNDTTAPVVTFVSPTPANNTFQTVSYALINATSVDQETFVSTCTLEFNGTNFSMTKVGSGLSVSCFRNHTSIANGTSTYKVYSNDTANNTGVSETRTIGVDATAPAIAFISPTPANNTFTNSSTITINVSHNETNPDTLRLFIDGSLNETQSYSIGFTNFTKVLAEGIHTYNATANDTAGNSNSTEVRTITIDVTNPTANITSPANNSWASDTTPEITFNLSDNLDTVLNYTIFVDGASNSQTGTSNNNSATLLNISALSQGTHTIIVQATDEALNKANSTALTINIDTTAPAVAFVSPTPANNTLTGSGTVTINVSHNETSPDKIKLFVDGTLNEIRNYSGTFTNFTVVLAVGVHNYSVTANDTTGNSNSTETRTITVDSTPPAGVTNLNEFATSIDYIAWNWTNPANADFNHTEVWLNGTFKTNVSAPANSYNATGLTASTTYEIQTRTVDNLGNINATFVNDTATTVTDATPPVITNVTNGTVTSTTAIILWTTDDFSNSTVLYGTNITDLSLSTLNSTLVQNHSILLSSLSLNTTYFYNVSSCSLGGCSSNGTFNFTTEFGLLADGSACTLSSQCSGGFCLHGTCRSSATFCGDSFCDSGEGCSSCSNDCGTCPSGGGSFTAGGGAPAVPTTPTPTPTPPTTEPVVSAISSEPGGQIAQITSAPIGTAIRVALSGVSDAISDIVIVPSVYIENSYLAFTELSSQTVDGQLEFVSEKSGVTSVSPEQYATPTEFKPGDIKIPIATYAAPPGELVYRSFNVYHVGLEGRIREVVFRINIDKRWAAANNADLNTVTTKREHNGVWENLPTYLVEEDATTYHFISVSPGLSTFAVVATSPPLLCAVCEVGTWSGCIDGEQSRLTNKCGPETGYSCWPAFEKRLCEVPLAPSVPAIPGDILIVPILAMAVGSYLIVSRRWKF